MEVGVGTRERKELAEGRAGLYRKRCGEAGEGIVRNVDVEMAGRKEKPERKREEVGQPGKEREREGETRQVQSRKGRNAVCPRVEEAREKSERAGS